jgi:uncharacterized protein (TIGR02996 family)
VLLFGVNEMTEGTLLQAVIAEPEDDVIRLVYADWLEEQGKQDRAEFIRGECELAHLPTTDRRHQRLAKHTSALWHQHVQEWFGPLVLLTEARFEVDRGFVHTVEVAA